MKPNDVIFESKDEAARVLDTLIEILGQYAIVSKADFFELVGLPTEYNDNKRGWTQLKNVKIRKVTSYALDLPPMEEITI